MASHERFGYEWDKYAQMSPLYEGQFLNWVGVPQENFIGEEVLDAGCGMGRNSYWALTYGAKSVLAFDFDKRSVAAAQATLNQFKNTQVLFKSIYEITWEKKFSLVFSIGVIHHLNNPKEALRNLVKSLKKDGILIVWVYSYEGNKWIVRFVNPIRKYLTSKLPVSIVHFLSYFCSVPLWAFAKIFRGPTKYIKQLSDFSFWHIHSIVFDQLIPEIANYWKKEEIESLFYDIGLSEFSIRCPRNKQGWTIIGRK